MEYSVIIPCAGQGKRMGLGYNKLLYQFDNKQTIIEKTIEIFVKDSQCKQIILVISEQDENTFKHLFANTQKVEWCFGGQERQNSVFAGLKLVEQDYVMIHDGARPFLTSECIHRLLVALKTDEACLLSVAAKDTIKIVDEYGYVIETPDRTTLLHAQTPQAFRTELIKRIHQLASVNHVFGTDDASLVEMLSDIPVKAVEGDYSNIKITTPEDLL